MLNEPIRIVCCTFCYVQMSEFHHQEKGLAFFLKWPHKGTFVSLVTLIKLPRSEFSGCRNLIFSI